MKHNRKSFDMHCDTISVLLEKRREAQPAGPDYGDLRENKGHIDLGKLEAGGCLVQNFALFTDTGNGRDPMEEALQMADLYYLELEKNRDRIAPVFRYRDIEENERAGRLSALLTIEDGGVCKGELAYLRDFYRLGVRMMTLTWNHRNELGAPNVDADRRRTDQGAEGEYGGKGGASVVPFYDIPDTVNGLTETGIAFVKEMERIGMIVDVSHLSDAGFYDVLRIARKPFVASHSNARAVCPWVRNLTDDMIRKLAERGGVTGLNYCADFLTENAGLASAVDLLDAAVRHARHIVNVGGLGCLGLGGDFDGIPDNAGLPDYSYLPELEQALRRAGFHESEVEAVFGGNVRRLYRELL